MFKPAAAAPPEVARLAVDTIKFLAIDAVEKANSGHPGLPMGAADYAFVLWSRYLKHDPRDPHWPDRDRFVLSAGHLGLGNLKYIYDDNKITLDGNLDESMSEDVARRFEAYGWRTVAIDGHDHAQISRALDEACAETERPMLILARTHIGNGAPNK